MDKKIIKIFIVVFIAIIATPIVLVNLKIKVKPINSSEKKISMNFKQNFPLKSDLINLFTHIKTEFLNTNPIPNKLITIDNGWKFLGNNYSNALSESKGIIVFTNEELEKLKTNLLLRKKWLNSNNITFFLAIAPNKLSIYGDMIPIKKYNRKTKLDQLDSLCKIIDVNFINLGSNFPEKPKKPLYYKSDTHWNDYAGLYAFQSTIAQIESKFPKTNFNKYTMKDLVLEISDTEFVGDLDEMLKKKKRENHIYLNFKNGFQSKSVTNKLELPTNYNKDPNNYEARFISNTNKLKILIFNDSFMATLSRYLRENFGESVFIWNHTFDKKLIKSEKPDLLYHEIVERDIDVLLNN